MPQSLFNSTLSMCFSSWIFFCVDFSLISFTYVQCYKSRIFNLSSPLFPWDLIWCFDEELIHRWLRLSDRFIFSVLISPESPISIVLSLLQKKKEEFIYLPIVWSLMSLLRICVWCGMSIYFWFSIGDFDFILFIRAAQMNFAFSSPSVSALFVASWSS